MAGRSGIVNAPGREWSGANGLARFIGGRLSGRGMTYRRLAPLALLIGASALAQEAAPPPAPLTLPQATALKCSAAFALGAAAQGRGEGREWPALAERGREFMVQSSARIMDETGRSRDAVALELTAQAKALTAPGALAAAMPACLLLLDASGL